MRTKEKYFRDLRIILWNLGRSMHYFREKGSTAPPIIYSYRYDNFVVNEIDNPDDEDLTLKAPIAAKVFFIAVC